MPRTHRNYFFAFVICISILVAGCEQTTISQIIKNPQQYSGEEVTIAGKVTNTAADDPTKGSFELDDGTGRLWVLSTSYQLPQRGARLAVTGLVEDAVPLGSNTLSTTLQEIKRQGEGKGQGD